MTDLRTPIGRSLVVGVRGSDPDGDDLRKDLETCAQAQVGGVILFDRDLPTGGARNIESPAQVRELSSSLRETLGADLLIMIDQEGGSVARLDADRGFEPVISAAEFAELDTRAQRDVARKQARQLMDLGINVNLAPVVDLAFAGQSSVIAGLGRSFGVDQEQIIECARIWVEEHRDAGVITCLKHFPGHGSALGDTHAGLVDISGRSSRQEELAPYRKLVGERGVMVMTGHLLEREIDPDLPASLSPAHTDGSLRSDIGFEGVVVTDSIDMGAIIARWSSGEAAVLAIASGADLVMDGVNAPGESRECPAMEMSDAILNAIESGRIDHGEARLRITAERIKRVHNQVLL